MDIKQLTFLLHLLLLCSCSGTSPVTESKSKRALDQNEFSTLDSLKLARLLEEVEAIFLRNIGSFDVEKMKTRRTASTFRIH